MPKNTKRKATRENAFKVQVPFKAIAHYPVPANTLIVAMVVNRELAYTGDWDDDAAVEQYIGNLTDTEYSDGGMEMRQFWTNENGDMMNSPLTATPVYWKDRDYRDTFFAIQFWATPVIVSNT